MKYNHSAMRQRFIKEQKKLAKQYRAAGMSEEAIQEMYKFDLAVFRSNRNDLAHKAEIEEMTAFDRVTGESHYIIWTWMSFPQTPSKRCIHRMIGSTIL